MQKNNQRRTINTSQEIPNNQQTNDPMIAKQLQKEQYVGIGMLVIALVVVVGFFSRRVEYALIFAAVLSLILIFLFLSV
jgi:flagellar biosynthesis/type III secretory pathway M-ring protein FliF/YscJ